MLRSFAVGIASAAISAGPALSCDNSDIPPISAAEAQASDIAYFKLVDVAYEGLVLGHDYERGGRFLVLQTYKGPAKPFQIIDLPPGNSCYEGLAGFGVWADYEKTGGVNSFVSNSTLATWRREGLVSASVLPSYLGVLAAAVILGGVLIRYLLRRRRPTR